MNLADKIVAVVKTIGADIKALYTGKAEKEHTHTADQVTGLGTAATKNVVQDTGTSTEDVMSQKAVTDAVNARGFADASGILTATSGALSNDMSSYLSSKTYAEMRAKLDVPKLGDCLLDPIDLPIAPSTSTGVTTMLVDTGDTVVPMKVIITPELNFSGGDWGLIPLRTARGTFQTSDGSEDYDAVNLRQVQELIKKIPTGSTINVVQEKGNSTTDVMSQEAVTINMDSLEVELDLLRQELDKLKDRLPVAIGDERWGGFYIGDITIPSGDDAGTYRVIMAGKEGQSIEKWKLTDTDNAGTSDYNNGKRNTLAMVEYGISEHPAGEYCVNYRGGGYDDWYLPSRNELALAWDNRALLIDLKMRTAEYWSSTQYTALQTWVFDFNREKKDVYSKTDNLWVRPVRRIKIELEP